MALSVEAFQSSHVSPSPKTFALRPGGVEGGVVSPVDDSRIVTARLSVPENDPPLKPTEADALAFALPVWNVPPDAVNERTSVRVCRSQIGVKEAEPLARPLRHGDGRRLAGRAARAGDRDRELGAAAGRAGELALVRDSHADAGHERDRPRGLDLGRWPFFETRTKALAVQLPSVNRLPLTTLERATCGVPVQVDVNVPEPPRSFWRM